MDNLTRGHRQPALESGSLSVFQVTLYTIISSFLIYFILSYLPYLFKSSQNTHNENGDLKQLKAEVQNLRQETQRLKAELEKSLEEDSEHKAIIIDSVKGVRDDIMEVLSGFAKGMEEAQEEVEQMKVQMQLSTLAVEHELL